MRCYCRGQATGPAANCCENVTGVNRADVEPGGIHSSCGLTFINGWDGGKGIGIKCQWEHLEVYKLVEIWLASHHESMDRMVRGSDYKWIQVLLQWIKYLLWVVTIFSTFHIILKTALEEWLVGLHKRERDPSHHILVSMKLLPSNY